MEVKPCPSIGKLCPAEVRLKRFLHFGNESPMYIPGDRFFQNCFTLDNFTALESMLADAATDKQNDAVSHILKAFMDGYSGYPECLVFALAACAQQKSSEKLRSLAYDAVRTICKVPQDIFLFVTFTKKLSAPNKGYGHGWRKAIAEWYLKKDPLELAEAVSRFRGNFGWTHRDLLKLSHMKANDKTRAVILTYVMKGIAAAKEEESEEVLDILSYLDMIEKFKHQENVLACAQLIETHKLTLEHVPTHNKFLNSEEVWMSLIPHMPIAQLLDNISRLSCLGFLRAGHVLVARIVERLTHPVPIVESHLHPTQVYIALRSYEEHAKNRHDFIAKLVKQGKVTKDIKPPAKPNTKITEALRKLMQSTLELLVPTGMRYLVAIDLSNNMVTWKCNSARDVAPAEAAVLLALCLLNAEREVTVVTYPAVPGPPPEEDLIDFESPIMHPVGRRGKGKTGCIIYPPKTELRPMQLVQLNTKKSLEENMEMLTKVPSGPVEVGQPIIWAQENRLSIDVFVVCTDYVTKRKREFLEPALALQNYREAIKLPNAKLVTCALVANSLDVADPLDLGMLDVCGFDGKMARVIEAFCRGAF